MNSKTNNLFESYNIKLNESTELDNQLKGLGILDIGASSEHKRTDEDELDKLQGQEFVKRLNDNPSNAQWYGYIYIKHKDLGDIFVSYNTNTNEIDTTGFPWKFIEKDTTPEQKEFIENNKEFLNNYIKSGEISKYKNLEESTKKLNEENYNTNSMYNFLKSKRKYLTNYYYNQNYRFGMSAKVGHTTIEDMYIKPEMNRIINMLVKNYGIDSKVAEEAVKALRSGARLNSVMKMLESTKNINKDDSKELDDFSNDVKKILDTLRNIKMTLATHEAEEIINRLLEDLPDILNDLDIDVSDDVIG